MAGEIALGAVLANCGRDHSSEFLEMMATGAPDVPVYRPRFEARGQAFAMLGDWQAVLGTGADLIAYGSLLWGAYNKFVRPRLVQSDDHRPFLLIVLSAGRGAQVHLSIDENWTEAELTDALVAKVDELRQRAADEDLELGWDFKDSARWSEYSPWRHS